MKHTISISHIRLTGTGSESLSMTILFTSENHIGRSDTRHSNVVIKFSEKGKWKQDVRKRKAMSV